MCVHLKCRSVPINIIAVKTIAQLNKHHGLERFETPKTAIVVKKFIDDKKPKISEIARPKTIKSTEVGDKDVKDVLKAAPSHI